MTKKKFEELKNLAIKQIKSYSDDIPAEIDSKYIDSYKRILNYYRNMVDIFFFLRLETKTTSSEIEELVARLKVLEESKEMLIPLLKGEFSMEDVEEYELVQKTLREFDEDDRVEHDASRNDIGSDIDFGSILTNGNIGLKN